MGAPPTPTGRVSRARAQVILRTGSLRWMTGLATRNLIRPKSPSKAGFACLRCI